MLSPCMKKRGNGRGCSTPDGSFFLHGSSRQKSLHQNLQLVVSFLACVFIWISERGGSRRKEAATAGRRAVHESTDGDCMAANEDFLQH
ncbi:hypothetical protein LXL04_017080 [Taraxacum kok-saghyz]